MKRNKILILMLTAFSLYVPTLSAQVVRKAAFKQAQNAVHIAVAKIVDHKSETSTLNALSEILTALKAARYNAPENMIQDYDAVISILSKLIWHIRFQMVKAYFGWKKPKEEKQLLNNTDFRDFFEKIKKLLPQQTHRHLKEQVGVLRAYCTVYHKLVAVI